MKLRQSILKAFLIILIILIQCTSKENNDQIKRVKSDYIKINSESEVITKSVPVVFECNFFGSPKPALQTELFAPEVFKDEDHQHSSPSFSPDGKEIYWSYVFTDRNTRSRKQVICFSKFENEQWTKPEIVAFSGNYYDGGPFITPDGKMMFYYSDRPVTQGSNPKSDYDLWYVKREGPSWGEPIHLEFNTDNNETMPSVSADGTIYFAAQYRGKEGPFHIYYSKLKDGKYSQPKSISPLINNDFRLSPYIAPDESFIIFATLNAPLHISFRDIEGNWGKPKNLENKINIGKSQRFPMLTPDRKFLFFTSFKTGKEERYWMDAQFLFE